MLKQRHVRTRGALRDGRGAQRVGSLFVDERRHALDLGDLDPRPRREHLTLVKGTSTPGLTANLHSPAVAIYLLEDNGGRAHESRRPGAQGGRHADMTARERAQRPERCRRANSEDYESDGEASTKNGDYSCGCGRNGKRTKEEESRRQQLADREQGSDEDPVQPDSHSLL